MNTNYIWLVISKSLVKCFVWKSENDYTSNYAPIIESKTYLTPTNTIEKIIGQYILEFKPQSPRIIYNNNYRFIPCYICLETLNIIN